jgi:8-oxo-dGTP pyrophosphatase MutT (NUDIX family)
LSTPEPRSAATVVLIRDAESGPEVLLLKRNKALLFAGGFWVFPGGALDGEDWETAGGDEEAAARIAAAREAREESGVVIDPDTMVQISHWTTPTAEPKRFYTWFYLAIAPARRDVTVDGGEIHDYQWIGVGDAIRQHESGELGLFPPTIMTLRSLQGYLTAEDALIGIAARDPFRVLPVFVARDGVVQIMFDGDAGYESGDPEVDGGRHRAQLKDGCWHYICSDLPGEQARLDI